jgi:two-component system, OmpR family, phosphate regulon sensor histidine kinase PhoR
MSLRSYPDDKRAKAPYACSMIGPVRYQILDHLDLPALLIDQGQVVFSNSAACSLLGNHIVGQDVRIALRIPAAVELISSEGGGRAQIKGLSVPGSIWDMTCYILADDQRFVTLSDASAQASITRAHTDFVANASHELRTPLAAILGYVETLLDPKAGEDAATRDRFLMIVQREARRMQSLVEDLMSLSRIEASKHDVPSDRIDLVALAHGVAGEFSGARIAIGTNVDQASIAGDRGQMAQVLRNLFDNAIKYGTPGGEISVAIEATKTGWISLSVHNEGEGIAPEHLPRLTERFYRADASRSRQAGGTGLGLSIVKHSVERHRGRFDISSRVGQGTTASLMLRSLED